MALQIERSPIVLKSQAGRVFKYELREAIGGVSRGVFVAQVNDFIETKGTDKSIIKTWKDHSRKKYLPEYFVLQFIAYLYLNVDMKVQIVSV